MNEKNENKRKRDEKPLFHAYWPLGKGRGISVDLFSSNLRLRRIEKDKNGKWTVRQEIALGRGTLEKLFPYIPYFLFKMRESEKKEVGK